MGEQGPQGNQGTAGSAGLKGPSGGDGASGDDVSKIYNVEDKQGCVTVYLKLTDINADPFPRHNLQRTNHSAALLLVV